MTNINQHSTDYYDSIASGYDELHKEEQMNKISIILTHLLRKLESKKNIEGASYPISSSPIVDVGCGTGFSLDIFSEASNLPCIGLEPSSEMIKQYSGKQQILVARGESLPFPDNFASACISITAIQNFDDVSKGVEEIIRISKKDAPIIISCLKKSSKLDEVSKILGDSLLIEEIIEEDKDIIFVCTNNKI